MASNVEICNRALQRLGASSIVSLTEDSRNARVCNLAFEPVKLSLLEEHEWNFAVKRAELAADSTNPAFGRDRQYQLPADFIRLAHRYPEDNRMDVDWLIEGRTILSDDLDPIQIRYIADITDPQEMPPLFREAFSAKLSMEISEELTQSNRKAERMFLWFDRAMKQARRSNAIQKPSGSPPDDIWITKRV